jgi:hypothetical protein
MELIKISWEKNNRSRLKDFLNFLTVSRLFVYLFEKSGIIHYAITVRLMGQMTLCTIIMG